MDLDMQIASPSFSSLMSSFYVTGSSCPEPGSLKIQYISLPLDSSLDRRRIFAGEYAAKAKVEGWINDKHRVECIYFMFVLWQLFLLHVYVQLPWGIG